MNSGRKPTPRQRALLVAIGRLLVVSALIISFNRVSAAPPPPNIEQAPGITLDPGHGGRDQGARGAAGQVEKKVSMDLARLLALTLEPAYGVTLTRSDDYDVALRQRAAIANESKSMIMISIHSGAGFVHAAKGVTIYYYAPQYTAPTPDAGAPEATEAWNRAQLRYKAASIALASALKTGLDAASELGECRIQNAPLAVLEGADMPAVLIELGYITHPATEKQLASAAYREQLARLLHKGIERYFKEAGIISRP